MPYLRDPDNWQEHATFLVEVLPRLQFSCVAGTPTIMTVWFLDDDDDVFMRVGGILHDLFGAYLCGPMSNVSLPDRLWHQSFGFWNQALLENARRVFPLPQDAQPGPVIFIGGASKGDIEAFQRVYDRQPGDLPQFHPF